LIVNGDIFTFDLFLKLGVKLNVCCKGLNLLQFTFRHGKNPEIINYVVNLGYNLDVDIDPSTTSEQIIYTNDNLTKKEKQQCVLYYLNKILNKPTVDLNYLDNISIEKQNIISDSI
jgi:hypothetical protein